MTCLDDATVLGLVEGRLAPGVLATVDEHIDSCASCRDIVTHVASARSPQRVLSAGDKVGRYVIGELLGTGAMGRVYAAWEPELDRRVAIKVLLEDAGAARERLVREAQAMAKLSHPNVVTVHEVGTSDAGVYVAMELVDGDSLRTWAIERRPWRDVVGVLVEIARGLAAVHAAGVVHRDVKPDNTIVGTDRRVRLGDFGLARSGAGAAGPTLAIGTDTTVAGTPAYMAPEVLRGGAATAASDQFSFGVMAHELLAGTRPFAGSTWTELVDTIQRHDVRPLEGVPAWLDAAIARCIASDPAARFASMAAVEELLAQRLAHKAPTRWLAGILAGALVASGVTLLAVRDRDAARGDDCAAATVWTPELSARLGFLDAPARQAIDRWAGSWHDMRGEVCRNAENIAPPRVAARERCLDDRRVGFAALVGRFDATSAPRALDAIAVLPQPTECRAADRDTADSLPSDPARAVTAREVQTELAAVRASIAIGEQGALATADALLARARTTEHAPTIAEALLARAEALRGADRLADAAADARDATAAAMRGRAELVGARAWLARVAIAGTRRDLGEADDVGALAQAAVERAGSPPYLVATLARLRGLIAYNRGDVDQALALLSDAEKRFSELTGPRSLEVATVKSALGSVHRYAGALDKAQALHEQALAIDLELRGEQHPDVARDLHNIAGVHRLRPDFALALRFYRKALAMEVAMQGERSIAAGVTHNSIGLVLMAQQQWDAARTELELARDILTAAGHGDRAFAEHNLGLLAQHRGQHREAIAQFDRAIAIYEATIGSDASAPGRVRSDRVASELALAPKKPVPRPTPPAAATTPAKRKDIGVYGSGQTW